MSECAALIFVCARALELTFRSTAPIEDISDEESGDIPFDDKNGTTEDAKEPDQVDDENEEDDDEEEEENVLVAHIDELFLGFEDLILTSFVVEKIVDHAWLDDVS